LIPTASIISSARPSASFLVMSSWIRSGSITCSEILMYGLSEVMGSWKIIETRFPRMERASFALQCRRSTPSNMAVPLSILPGGIGIRPMME